MEPSVGLKTNFFFFFFFNDALEEKPLHPGVTSKETFTAEIIQMEQLLREVLIYSLSHPNLLFSSMPSPRLTHSHFLSLCLKFFHNLLYSFSAFNLHTDHPPPPPKSNLSMAARAISLKCKSDHIVVLFKPTCGSLLNSELSQSFLG